jgi:hypothetical protein
MARRKGPGPSITGRQNGQTAEKPHSPAKNLRLVNERVPSESIFNHGKKVPRKGADLLDHIPMRQNR